LLSHLSKYVAKLQPDPVEMLKIPIILLGDFNTRPFSPSYNLLSGDEQFKSSYSYYPHYKEAPYTLLRGTNPITLDYIWYHSSRLRVEKLLEVPSFIKVMRQGRFPNEYWPSDHVSIAAEFSVTDDSSSRIANLLD
jgi:endonuclease/exonuclease/phosphatase family metal-dependent hydrolase